jgi:hypothetical protein
MMSFKLLMLKGKRLQEKQLKHMLECQVFGEEGGDKSAGRATLLRMMSLQIISTTHKSQLTSSREPAP